MIRSRNDELYSYSFNGHQFILKKLYISNDPRDFTDNNYKWVLGLRDKSMDYITIKTVDKEIKSSELLTFQSNVINQPPMFESRVFADDADDILKKITILENGQCN
ncbi:hypothetical protein ACFQIC_14975 [Halobacillus seohaensis]|uniref:Uncharacterized protein n=1 Tax=Halobacillus seohaensis TaxID=447421 RepID=A0ABW2ENS1_9BACI